MRKGKREKAKKIKRRGSEGTREEKGGEGVFQPHAELTKYKCYDMQDRAIFSLNARSSIARVHNLF